MGRAPWAALLLLAVIFMAALACPCASFAEPPAKPRAESLAVARPAPLRVVLSGFTRARATLPLISEVPGRCLAVTAEVGEAIGPQGIFARLDPTFTKLDLEANLLEQARMKSRESYLAKEAKRHRALVVRKSEPQSSLDKLEEDLAQASLSLKALITKEKVLRERLSRFAIKAPPGWLVMSREVEPGQWVAAGTRLGAVGDYATLLVPLALTPREHLALKAIKGPITLRATLGSGKVAASIFRVSPAFDPQTRKIKVDLAVKKGPAVDRGGVRLELDLDLPDASGAVLVPDGALSRRYQEYWLTRPDQSQVRVVRLGPGPEPGLVKVQSPQVKAGMKFILAH